MRKAFDENVPRLKPRLKLSSLFPQGEGQEALVTTEAPAAIEPGTPVEMATAAPTATEAPPLEWRSSSSVPAPAPVAEVAPAPARATSPAPAPVLALEPKPVPAPKAVKAAAPPAPAKDPVAEAQARRRKLKERLKLASQPVTLAEPTPPTAVEARASALSLVGQLQAELEKANAMNAALTADLDSARNELARAIEEAKGRSTDTDRLSAEVGQRAELIEELG